MRVKCRQDNLHRMTCYTGTYGSNGHGLTIQVSFMVKSVLYGALEPLVSWQRCNHSQWYGHYRMDIISQCGPLRSDLIVPLMLRMVCFCAMARALTLYYRSLGQHQPYWDGVKSRVDHNVELWPLFSSFAYITIIYLSRVTSCHVGTVYL